MANIAITTRCPRTCACCFARQEPADMTPERFDRVLDFLERSRFPEARLLGGEPTVHSGFVDFVSLARQRGFRVVVFTGGWVPPPALDLISTLPPDGFSVVLNLADPATDDRETVHRQRELCRRLGERVTAGINVVSPMQDPSFALAMVEEFGLRRTVRVGIANPVWGGQNTFFRFRGPRRLPVFERMAETAYKRGLRIAFDCGFTPCMFSPGFVEENATLFMPPTSAGSGTAYEAEPSDGPEILGLRCGPVIDILPDGDAVPCFALSGFRRYRLPNQGTRDQLAAEIDADLTARLPAGVHRECLRCGFRETGLCGGGCRARRAARLRLAEIT